MQFGSRSRYGQPKTVALPDPADTRVAPVEQRYLRIETSATGCSTGWFQLHKSYC
jgi:hypothetical protein